jgi:hypothetical protein
MRTSPILLYLHPMPLQNHLAARVFFCHWGNLSWVHVWLQRMCEVMALKQTKCPTHFDKNLLKHPAQDHIFLCWLLPNPFCLLNSYIESLLSSDSCSLFIIIKLISLISSFAVVCHDFMNFNLIPSAFVIPPASYHLHIFINVVPSLSSKLLVIIMIWFNETI